MGCVPLRRRLLGVRIHLLRFVCRTFRLVAIRFRKILFLFQMLFDLIGELNSYSRSRLLYQVS
jgi:hypothetical protein